MFGQASRPFGFGASTTPTFGATAFGATPTPAFGAAATPAFGAATPAPAFGATATPAFGTSTPAFGSTTPSAFGATPTPAFGGGATTFGASSMTPFGGGGGSTFGASTAPAFGSTAPASSAFGAASPAPTTFGGFGSTTQPTSTFGASTQPSAFGTPSTTGFGGTTTSSFAFGAGFGSTAPTPSPFGATTTPAPFSSPFGAPATTTATPAATAGTGSMFGATTTGFGTFGQPAAAAGATTTGTGNPKFQVTTESDANGTVSHQSITAMAAYNKKSFEELRWEDYQAGKKNNTSPALSASAAPSPFGTPTTTTTTPFGAAPTTTSTAFSFPTTTTPASPFGAPSTTTTTTPSFGFTTPTTTTPTTTTPFGTTTSTFPTFGAPTLSTAPTTSTTTTPFGGFAPTTSTANPFGTTAPSTSTSPFGTSTTPSFTAPTFAAPTTTTATPAFGTTSTANPFGAPASTTTSLFSTTATTNPFSTTTPSFTAPSLSTTSNLFNPAPTTLPSTTSLFSAAPSAAPTTLFSGFSTPSLQIGLGTQPTLATPTTSITSPPVSAPLPTFAVPSTPTPIIQASPVAAIPPLSFTPRTPTPQKNSYVSSLPRSLPARSGSLVRVKDSPSYGGGRLFTEDKGFSPSGVHITPENLSLRTATPSKPRVDIKKLNLPPFDERQLSATKPALDISSSSDIHSSQLVTPTRPQPFSIQTTPARVRPEANEIPTLRNPNYYTKPTMDTIREMGSAELSRVEDFTLGCAELGFVRWHGKTDIRGLNLDDIVVFERKAVTVYPEQGIYPKPPLGEGLNKPATITLLGVVPKKQDTAEKYAQMIMNATKKFDGKLLRYDPEKGIWEFEVRHFSRYGLSDDDEEPDVNDATSTATSVVAPIEQDTKVLAPKALIAPDMSAPFSQPPPFSSQPSPLPAQSPSALQMSVYAPPEPKGNRSARLSGLSTRGLLFTEEPVLQQQPVPTQKLKILPEPPFSQSFITKEHERSERIKSNVPTKFNRQVQNPVPIFTTSPQADQDSSFVVAPLLRLKQLALAESVVSKAPQSQSDISLTMGRSFRVGWAPNGRLVRMSANLGTVTLSRPALSTVSVASPDTASLTADSNTSGHLERIDRHILELLQTHLSHSTAQYGPHFTLKDLHANIQANIRICDPNAELNGSGEKANLRQHLYLVWTLVYSLWGKMPDGAFPQEVAKQLPPDLDADNDEAARLISAHLTRKLLVSKWLTHALQGPVEDAVKSVKLSSGNNALAILHYLTGRQISPAVALAQRSRDYRLAVLLTQTWTSALQLLGPQIEQWEVSNALPFIDKQLLAVYKLLAGDVEHVGRNIQDIRDDWLRSFALHFWFKHIPSTSMPEVLDTYDLAVEKGSASAAIPAYVKNKESINANSTVKDSLYRLLQLYSSTTHHQAIPGGAASQAGPTITTTRFAPSTSSLPTTLLLSAINPANQTPDPMDFSLAWHLYTTLRIIPALSSLVDLPVPHRLHTSYAAQLEISGYWQWAIYVLLHINFDSHKTVNGEWGFASGRQEAISSILERHAPNISEGHYQFLTQELQVPASWVDTAIGRYLVYDRKYQAGVQRLLRAGEWNEAHRTVVSHLAPFVVAPSSTDNDNVVTEDTLINLLEGLQPNYTHLADPTWNMGGHIYLAYLKLKQKLGPMPPANEDNDKSNFQTLVSEIPHIYSLCELVAQWNQAHMTQANSQQTRSKISMVCIATYLGRALQALAQTHRDANLPQRLHALPLPPDVRAVIMEDYFQTMIYAV